MTSDVYQKLFEQAKKNPQLLAILSDKEKITYSGLLQRVGGYSALFEKKSITKVAIYLPSGIESISAMFAALSIGAEYSPINIDAPLERVTSIINCYRPDVVLTDKVSFNLFQSSPFMLRLCPEQVENRPATVASVYADRQPAYTMFTSGTTGSPKGVVIPRIGLNMYSSWVRSAIPVIAGERWSQHPNIAFDLSVMDIFGALTQSATLVIASSQLDRLFPALMIRKYQINIWNSVPSIFMLIEQSKHLNRDYLSSLRFITFCGEPLKATMLRNILNALPGVRVQNTYGPTEATVSCTAIIFNGDQTESIPAGSVTLGSAIPGIQLMIQPEHEDEGELIISGDQVAIGYINDDCLTKKKFFEIVDSEGIVKRAFRSGDKVRLLDGQIYFVSRIDDTCKIKGHLVNLCGLESVLVNILKQNVISTVYQDQVHIFINSPSAMTLDDIRREAQVTMMDYELPVAIHVIEDFPKNMNDKIDRKVLNQCLAK